MSRPLSRSGESLVVLVMVVGLVLVVPALDGSAPGRPSEAAGTARPLTGDRVLRVDDGPRAPGAGDRPVDGTAPAAAPGPYTPLGRVALPTTGLDVEFAAGTGPSVLERGPGHWPGTALPGRPGTAVLSGYRTAPPAPFADLERLERGDPVVLTPVGEDPVEHRVTAVEVVPEADHVEAALRPPADPAARALTLSACHPAGECTHRIVVRASAPPPAGG